MANKDQIKAEIFISLRKRFHEPAIHDIVVINLMRSSITKKYQYHLTEDEFNTIGDELADAGYCRWNDDGRLALTAEGLAYLAKLR
jgi:hypothetical protein